MFGCRPVVKMTHIEGRRYGVIGEQESIHKVELQLALRTLNALQTLDIA